MTVSTNCNHAFGKRFFLQLVLLATAIVSATDSRGADSGQVPKPPVSERINVTELPLPPTAPSSDPGACTPAINPNRTGCIESAQSGSFLPDGHEVLAVVGFVGAPAAPDPASIYQGLRIILVKTDGTKFPNGDPWKCVTCGVPEQNALGISSAWDYPQTFHDGKRILAGTNIIHCSPFQLAETQCTAERVHIYPIRWEIHAGGSGKGGSIRELFAADLLTGKVRRLTSNPEYADPIDASPDDEWVVVEDTRGSDRQMFVAAMWGIPPLTDLVTSGAVSSIRNNGQRRFFQPFLIDGYGDRGNYEGQQLNAGDGKPGSISDPNWNAMADPRWSPDGTSVVYWQTLVTSPACGGSNPLPCPISTEPGGRRFRMMIARFTSRKPLSIRPPSPISDSLSWGTPYTPGSPIHTRALIPEGTYTLRGLLSGFAKVTIAQTADHSAIATVTVSYDNYSDERDNIINGTESVSQTRPTPTKTSLDWHSDLVQTGSVKGRKLTSPDGFKLTIDIMMNDFFAVGTLTTTINGQTYKQPANGD